MLWNTRSAALAATCSIPLLSSARCKGAIKESARKWLVRRGAASADTEHWSDMNSIDSGR
jgi:hypothetical protein